MNIGSNPIERKEWYYMNVLTFHLVELVDTLDLKSNLYILKVTVQVR